MNMHLFSLISEKLYAHIVSYLPWSYTAPNYNTIDVIKINDGLRVVVTDLGSDDSGKGYRKITVDVPQSEIEKLLAR